jgi:hypothetical protein
MVVVFPVPLTPQTIIVFKPMSEFIIFFSSGFKIFEISSEKIL